MVIVRYWVSLANHIASSSVILNEVKNLFSITGQMLRFAQHYNSESVSLS